MDQRVVVAGGRPLQGRLRVQGAKNAVLPLLAACLLAREPCLLLDAPRLSDVATMSGILQHLGLDIHAVEVDGVPALQVDARALSGYEVPGALMRRLRSSIFLLGPLLARVGRARLTLPGGCDIGPRPVDFHLRALQALGATVSVSEGVIDAEAVRLRAAEIRLEQPSVGATENVMMAATAAEGTTLIRNAAREPEVADLQAFLNAMGARVSGAGGGVIAVRGPSVLAGAVHTVIPDRVEAGTWLIATAIAGGCLELANVVAPHLDAVRAKIEEAGFPVRPSAGGLMLEARRRPRPVRVHTQPYPGFPTDLQNPFMALLLRATGTSTVTETIFDNRFRVVQGFLRMGAQVSTYGRVAVINGVPGLHGAEVEDAPDLRGAAALVLAGLAAEGVTVVRQAACLDRGYQDFAERLQALGADVRVETGEEQPARA